MLELHRMMAPQDPNCINISRKIEGYLCKEVRDKRESLWKSIKMM